MKTRTLWTLIVALATSVALEPSASFALVEVPSRPVLRSPAKLGGPLLGKRKKRKRLRRAGRVQPLGGPSCSGTSVVTETDEAGNPFYPYEIAPVTTESFIFTHVRRPILAPEVFLLRALALGEDPPMVTLGSAPLYHPALEPGRTTIAGATSIDGEHAIVRCTIQAPSTCEVAIPLGRHRPVLDLKAVDEDLFAVVVMDGQGSDVTRFINGAGEEFSILEVADLPGFFERRVAIRGDVAFVAGYLSTERRSMVLAVPLDGGPIREEVGFEDSQQTVGDLTVLGSDLVIEVDALVSQESGSAQAFPSRVVRIHLDEAGVATDLTEIPVDVPGFVNITDLEQLGGQLFAVDSRRIPPASLPTFDDTSGRILRICP